MGPILFERPVCVCEECGTELYEGDSFWRVEGYKYCEECAKEWFKSQRETVVRDRR